MKRLPLIASFFATLSLTTAEGRSPAGESDKGKRRVTGGYEPTGETIGTATIDDFCSDLTAVEAALLQTGFDVLGPSAVANSAVDCRCADTDPLTVECSSLYQLEGMPLPWADVQVVARLQLPVSNATRVAWVTR